MRVFKKHTHIFGMCEGKIRIIVMSDHPDLSWNSWFEANPDVRLRLQKILLTEAAKKYSE